MLQIITHCFEFLFIVPYTQLLKPYHIDIPVNTSLYRESTAPPSPIVCERLPLHLFELHQVNTIIGKHLNSSTVNSSCDIYKRMQAISIFIEDSLSRTCEFVSQQILLTCHLSLSYYRHPLNVIQQ